MLAPQMKKYKSDFLEQPIEPSVGQLVARGDTPRATPHRSAARATISGMVDVTALADQIRARRAEIERASNKEQAANFLAADVARLRLAYGDKVTAEAIRMALKPVH